MADKTFDLAMIEGYTYCPGCGDWPVTSTVHGGCSRRFSWALSPGVHWSHWCLGAATCWALDLLTCASPPPAAVIAFRRPASGNCCSNAGVSRWDSYTDRLDYAKQKGYLNRTVFTFGFLIGRSVRALYASYSVVW